MGEPVSYLLPALSPEARFFGVWEYEETLASSNTLTTRRLQQALTEAGARKIFVISRYPMSMGTRYRVGSFGLQPTGRCTVIPGFAYDSRTNLACELVQVTDTRPTATELAPDRDVDFRAIADNFTILASATNADWRSPGPIAVVQQGNEPGCRFRRTSRGKGSKALRLELTCRLADGSAADRDVIPLINGFPPTDSRAVVGSDGQTRTLTACIAEERLDGSNEGADIIHLGLHGTDALPGWADIGPVRLRIETLRWNSDDKLCDGGAVGPAEGAMGEAVD